MSGARGPMNNCPHCGLRGPDFAESPKPSDVCHHDPDDIQHLENSQVIVRVRAARDLLASGRAGEARERLDYLLIELGVVV